MEGVTRFASEGLMKALCADDLKRTKGLEVKDVVRRLTAVAHFLPFNFFFFSLM